MPRPVRIVVDSTADIPEDAAREWNITSIPLGVVFSSGETYRDLIDLDRDAFMAKLLNSPLLPTSSQPSVGAFTAIYENLAAQGFDVLSIHISGGLSGTVQAAQAAASAIQGAAVRVIDSRQISLAFGYAAIQAAKAAAAGATLDEAYDLATDVIPRSQIFVLLDSLDYVYKGGRIGRAEHLLGSVLAVKPMVSIINGVVDAVSKPRTRKRGLEELAHLSDKLGPLEALFLVHAHSPNVAAQAHEVLQQTFPSRDIPIVDTNFILTMYSGPGSVATVCVQEKISEAR